MGFLSEILLRSFAHWRESIEEIIQAKTEFKEVDGGWNLETEAPKAGLSIKFFEGNCECKQEVYDGLCAKGLVQLNQLPEYTRGVVIAYETYINGTIETTRAA